MYPYNLLDQKIEISPIFGEKKKISFLSMDDNSKWLNSLEDETIKNQEKFQKEINKVLESTKSDIIVSGYLENRKRMFEALGFQMVEDKRFYHLGLDLSVNLSTLLYSPIDGIVYEIGYEEGNGNYGGYIIIEHNFHGEKFYTLYGHLNTDQIKFKKGDFIKSGTNIGKIGDFNENGGYFYHTHMQVITEEGKEKGFFNKGYCSEEELKEIKNYVPDSSFLFRY